MTLDPVVAELAVLLGEGFARDLRRVPTKQEIEVVLKHIASLPRPAETHHVIKAWDAALAEIRAASGETS